jgi:hypothetical protein
MFRTSNISSTAVLYKQLTAFHHASYEKSSGWHDKNYIISMIWTIYVTEGRILVSPALDHMAPLPYTLSKLSMKLLTQIASNNTFGKTKSCRSSVCIYIRLWTGIQRNVSKVSGRDSNISPFYRLQTGSRTKPTTCQEVTCELRPVTGARNLPMWLRNWESGELCLHYPIRLSDTVLN